MRKFSALLFVLCIFCLGANNIEIEAADNKPQLLNFDLSLSLECLEHFKNKDAEKAKLSCKAACDKGDGRACYHLAGFLSRTDIKEFLSNIAKGCELMYDEACNRLAIIYANDGKYEKQALEFYILACDLDNTFSCNLLGNYYYLNAMNKDDVYKALGYFEKSCHNGFNKSCYMAGEIYRGKALVAQKNKNISEVKEYLLYSEAYLDRSCDKNYKEGCDLLGQIYESGLLGVDKIDKSLFLYEKACDLKNYESCFRLGEYYSDKKNKRKMKKKNLKEYYELACKGDIVEACAKIHPLVYQLPKKQDQVK